MGRAKKAYGVTPWGAALRARLTSLGGRVDRGEALARTGKVFDVEVRGGRVDARVRGSYAPYYDVSCAWERAPAGAAALARAAVARDPALCAELVAGALPVALLDALEAAAVHVLPRSYQELHGQCNCPDNTSSGDRFFGLARKDPNDPCKHQAALMFELIGELDKNPSTLLALRGLSLSDMLGEVGDGQAGAAATELLYPMSVTEFRQTKEPVEAESDDTAPLQTKKECPEVKTEAKFKTEAVAQVTAKEEDMEIGIDADGADTGHAADSVRPPKIEEAAGRRRSQRIRRMSVDKTPHASSVAVERAVVVKREDRVKRAAVVKREVPTKQDAIVKHEELRKQAADVKVENGVAMTSPTPAPHQRRGVVTFPKLASSSRVILQTLASKPMFSKDDFQAVLRDFYGSLTNKRCMANVMEPQEWEAKLDVDTVRPVIERSEMMLVLPQSMVVHNAFVIVESDMWCNPATQSLGKGQIRRSKNRGHSKMENASALDHSSFEKTPEETLSTVPFEVYDENAESGAVRVNITLDVFRRLLLRLLSIGVVGSDSFRFFSSLVRVSSLLFASANFVPDVVPLPNCASWTIMWRPFASNDAVAKCLRQLENQHPASHSVVQLRKKSAPTGRVHLNASSGVVHALSAILTHFVVESDFNSGKTVSPERMSFFANEPYSSVSFSDKSNGIVVKRWLSVFGLLSMKAEIVLKLEEPLMEEQGLPFSVSLYFRDAAGSHSKGREQTPVRDALEGGEASNVDDNTVTVKNGPSHLTNLEDKGWAKPQNYMATGSQQATDAIKFVVALKEYIPQVHSLLKNGTAFISTDDFERFILEKSGALRALGTLLVLPRGIKKILRPRIVKEVSLDISDDKLSWRKKYFEMASLMEFNYKVVIGDAVIDIAEFEEMVESGKRLYHFKGKYVELDPKNVADILKTSKTPLGDEELGLGLLRNLVSGNPSFRMTRDVAQLIAGIQQIEDLSVPASIRATLRGYQVTGFKWMMSNLNALGGCALLDDMGLGKTIQAICVIAHLKECGLTEDCPSIVVCPTSLISNWRRELRRFAPSVSLAIIGGPKRSSRFQSCVGKKRTRGSPDVLLMSYGTLRTDVAALCKHMFSLIVLDESQYIKNHSSQVAKACKKVGAKCGMRLALTGTVVENRLAELHGCFDFILPSYLGKLKFFVDRFAKPIERERDQDALDELKRMTGPFMLRRLKTDPAVISDLPEKVETKQFVSLSQEQIALYEAVREETFDVLESEAPVGSGIKRSGVVLKLLTSLKQICNHPASYGERAEDLSPERSEKCMALFDLLTPIIESGEKYVRMCRILEKQVADRFGLRPLVFEGSLSQAKRDEVVSSFERNPAKQVLVLSVRAGGVGLNLTSANHCIMFDRWYNPSVESQATDRAFRIGQKKNVFVHKFVCSNTFEMKIDDMIEAKREISELSVGQGEHWIGKMNNDELRDLFSISVAEGA